MNANDLQYLIEHPEAVRTIDKVSLEQLTREHPYFSAVYSLIAKRAQLHKESNFESKLNLAAAYTADRVRLYEFMQEPLEVFVPTTVALEQSAPETIPVTIQESEDSELKNLLLSIHERKQQFLGTDIVAAHETSEQKDVEELEILHELKAAGSEFSPIPFDVAEEDAEPIDTGIDAVELEMLQEMEQQIEAQIEHDRKEEFIIINESAGDGEYVPLHELLSEEAEDSFIEEHDPEVASISVIEEEFILRDLDQDIKLYEIGALANAESPILVEQEASAGMDLPDESEIEAIKSVAFEMVKQDTLFKLDELQLFNLKGGGGADYIPMEVNELPDQTESLPLSGETESIHRLENASAEQETVETNVNPQIVHEEVSSLRFTEHVPSPGAFLPGKSYSFIGWLQFFKPETTKSTTITRENKNKASSGKEELIENNTGEDDIALFSEGVREEGENIDRIVASLRHEPVEGTELLLSPSDLARKSIELDDDLVSETLATIYESQGLINKAIHMYARLSLKFPEKSLFFAARIKELKSKK